MRFHVVANFYAEPLADCLKFWLSRLGLTDSEVCFAPYNQVLQELMDPASGANHPSPGVNFFLLRPGDWARDAPLPQVESVIRGSTDLCLEAFSAYASRTLRPSIVFLCRPLETGDTGPNLAVSASTATERLRTRLVGCPGVQVYSHMDLVALYAVSTCEDLALDRSNHIPFTEEYWTALGTYLIRRARPLFQTPCKVIVADADNTLWGGVVAESGPFGVVMEEGHRHLQKFLLAKKEQGILLALASKNRAEDVLAVLQRPDLPLKQTDLVAWKIGWEPKSVALRQLSAELELGLESFLLLDDNPVECAEVMAACPEVAAVRLPESAAEFEQFLAHLWPADVLPNTRVDAHRTELYRQQSLRNEARASHATLRDFLASLELAVSIRAVTLESMDRAVQLTQRTNQFNNTTIRRNFSELATLLQSGSREAILFGARDRFGDYGDVGLCIFYRADTTIVVESFLLSCRALGKGVEHQMLAELGRRAVAAGARTLTLPFCQTERNEPALRFLTSLGTQPGPTGDYIVGATDASLIEFQPDEVPGSKPVSIQQPEFRGKPTVDSSWINAEFIACELNTVGKIQAAVRTYLCRARPELNINFRAPEGATESAIAEIWQEVLRVAPIGADDPLWELGGQSLQAVQILARVNARFDVDLPPSILFTPPTVASMAMATAGCVHSPDSRPLPTHSEPALSPTQERMWFLDQFIPQRSAYNVVAARLIRGAFDVNAWQAALASVSAANPTLRSRIVESGGHPRLVIDSTSSPAFEELRCGSTEEALSRIERAATDPFDLTHGSLLRSLVASVSDREHYVLLNVHHLVIDGWSLNLLWLQLSEAYAAARMGRVWSAPQMPHTYADYARWMRDRLAAAEFEGDLEYWRRSLRGAPPLLQLPTDFPRPAVMNYEGGMASQFIPVALALRVEELARAEGGTPFAVLMASFVALLYRYSGQSEVLIGTPVAGRAHPTWENLIGCFVNTVVVRSDVAGTRPFRELLRSVMSSGWEALAHQELPFEKLVDALGLDRDLSHAPLFQVMLVFQNSPPGDLSHPEFSTTPVMVHNGGAKFDLVLEITPRARGFELVLEFATSLFRPETATRILDHFLSVLDSVCASPNEMVDRLPMLSPAEREQLVVHFNRTECVYPEALSLPALFEEQVARTPDARALTFEDRSLSYRELDERANQLAHFLRRRDVGPDVLVGICVERSLEMVVGLLGILKAGGAYVPIDPTYPPERLAYLVQDVGASVLLTQEHLRTALPPHPGQTICLDSGWSGIAVESRVRPASCTTPDHLAYMIYTSGSTGRPKGALNTHRGILNRLHWMQAEYRLTAADTVLQKTPFSFDVSVWEFFWPLITGARLVVARPEGHKDPDYLVELIEKECVTVLHFVPSMLRAFLDADRLERCGSLREIICSGEALPPDVVVSCHAKLQANLHNLYGPTEAAVDVTYWACPRDRVVDIVPIGRPVANTQCYILDAHLQPVPVGVAGELHLGGVQIGRGYHNRPELTAQKFIPDPFRSAPDARLYKTGDLCRYLPDGNIEYLGRIDHQVKIRGFRVELGEIEAVLCEHPAIREALVLAREEAGTTRLVAYAVVHAVVHAVRPAVGELREHLRRKLPDYMVPAAFVFLESFPLSHNGKIDRKALPEPDCDRAESATAYSAPVSPAEQELARIWSGVLRRDRVGIDDNFFELGGDSILSIQVISLARKAGLNLSPRLLFQHPTIRHLAAAVRSPTESPTAAKEQGPVSGAVGLTPILHWFLEQNLAEPNHYNQAFLLELRSPIDPDPLRRALARLELQHDVLRLRLTHAEGPVLEQAAPGDDVPLEVVDLSPESDAGLPARLEELCGRAQASLDLVHGPLWRAVLFQLGPHRPPRLLLAVHHIAVDGVSWRLLLEDLELAYQREKSGVAAALASKTTSFQAWAAHLQDAAREGRFANEIGFWRQQVDGCLPAIPVDFDRGQNTEASARTVTVRLEPAETQALLQQAPARYNTRINDLLLSALGVAMNRWSARDELAISLEGHGREDLFEQVDLSRTVGWFTAIYPLRLRVGETDLGRLICSVKEQLRAVPHSGFGYGLLRYLGGDPRLAAAPEPELLFNYFGQFDQVVAGSTLFRFASESAGPWHSPRSLRRPLLEVNAMVVHGSMEFTWTYSEHRHAADTIQRLAGAFVAALRDVIQHCLAAATRGATPSDFPLAALDQPALDRLLQQAPDLEDVYPPSPIQSLFYTVALSDHRKVLDQWHCLLRGPLDAQRFQSAWQSVFARHPVLRTSFHAAGPSRTVQVVHGPQPVDWTMEDWRTFPADEQAGRWLAWLKTDHDRGLPLDHSPLSRFALFRVGQEAWRFVWTVPALLLDGWSWPLVFRDLCRVYEQLGHDTRVELEPAPPYRCYLEWLSRRGTQDAETFWKTELAGLTAPTPLVAGDVSRMTHRTAITESPEWRATIPAEKAAELTAMARSRQVSPNTLIQAAWAATMARQSGQRDVLFGAAFSGRPADLDRAGEVVGPFVNNLPVRVTLSEPTRLRDWLGVVQERLFRVNEHQFVSALQVQGWSKIPWRHRLFESLVVVQNYVVSEAARRVGPRVFVEEFVGPIHSNLPLLLLVEPRAEWQVTLLFDPREVAAEAAARWGADFLRALELLVSRPEDTVGDLLEALSAPVAATASRPRWQVAAQDYAAPGSELERRIARLWEEWLGLERISVEQNVFDLGVHSLLVVRLHEAMCGELQRELPLIDLFQYPTVRALAGRIAGGAAAREQETAKALSGRASRQREALARMKTAGKGR